VGQDETQQLWRDYRKSKDQGVRDRLILTYAPLVKYVAGRLGSGLPAHVDENDLVSYGLLGLIGAIERYDPARDIKFETYAIARIKGAIIDELRALDWVPRSVRSRAREIERAIAELEAKLGTAPTDEQIAQKIGITVEELEDRSGDRAPGGRAGAAAEPRRPGTGGHGPRRDPRRSALRRAPSG
jgi:RNA polymerase sigma factor FliA